MANDVFQFVQKCDKCQRFASISHVPQQELHSVNSSWPFLQWGIDILSQILTCDRRLFYQIDRSQIFDNYNRAKCDQVCME